MQVFVLLFSAAFFFHYGDDYWWSKWFAFQVLATLGVARGIARQIHWSVGLTVGWMCLSALWVFAWRDNVFQTYAPVVAVSFESVAANAAFTLLAFCFFFISISEETLDAIESFVAATCIVVSAMVVFQFLSGKRGDDIYGAFSQASMSGVYVALSAPIFFRRARDTSLRWFGLLVPVAIAILGAAAGASAPIGMFGIVCGAWIVMAWIQSGVMPPFRVSLIAAIPALFALLFNSHVFSSASRWRMYELVLDWWWTHDPLVGSGHSTLFTYLGHIQALAKQPELLSTHRWIWLHNDWLQILAESGLIGFVLTALVFIFALKAAWKKQRADLFSSLCGLGAVSVIQYPLHLAAHAFVSALIVYRCFEKESK